MEGLIEGRIVHYVLTEADVKMLRHEDNNISEGMHCPMIIVRVWSETGNVDGQVFLDGPAGYWAQKVNPDPHPESELKPNVRKSGTWHWIERA
jgi:hypothetical protein